MSSQRCITQLLLLEVELIPACSLFTLVCHGKWLGKHSDLCFIQFKMDEIFSVVSKHVKWQLLGFLCTKMKLASESSSNYWLFIVKMLWT